MYRREVPNDEVCSTGQAMNLEGVCVDVPPARKRHGTCLAGEVKDVDGNCVTPPARKRRGTMPGKCPPGQVHNDDGMCVDLLGPCPPGQVHNDDGMCVCPPGQVHNDDGMCVDLLGPCPPGQVHNADGMCVCPPGRLDVFGTCVDVLARRIGRHAGDAGHDPCEKKNGGYSTRFTSVNKKILRDWKLRNKNLILDPSSTSRETIEWTQAKRCWWLCSEDYILADYYDEDDVKKELPIKVYVAREAGPPPKRFSTSGHSAAESSKLHFGNVFFDKAGGSAIFFVIHPNAWGPYQHRFKTSYLTEAFQDTTKLIVEAGATAGITAAIASAAASGAAIGSFIPGPGTAAGAALGVAVGSAGTAIAALTDDYVGDYLRYIG